MSTNGAIYGTSRTLKVQTRVSALIFALGLALMVFMITTESEPGAIPLLLVVVGLGWLLITRARVRTSRRSGRASATKA